jgi:hypothetical protein
MNRKLWKRQFGRERRRVILDYDSTTMTVYGEQEGADRGRSFRKKDNPGFQPKFGFIGGLGLMVNQELFPQSHNLSKDFLAFHEATRSKLPRGVEIWALRGDAAVYSLKTVTYCERKGLVYGITASRTEKLRERILAIPEEEWTEAQDEYGSPISVARISYCPKTWDGKERTYVVSRRLKDDPKQGVLWAGERYKYFAYITNRRATVVEQYLFCVERCSLESFIKESKNGFHYDFLPCREETANRAYLGHVQLAYNLSIFFKLAAAPRGINRWTIQTLRDRILCVPGTIVREAKRWIVSLPSWWPYQTVFETIRKRCWAIAPA